MVFVNLSISLLTGIVACTLLGLIKVRVLDLEVSRPPSPLTRDPDQASPTTTTTTSLDDAGAVKPAGSPSAVFAKELKGALHYRIDVTGGTQYTNPLADRTHRTAALKDCRLEFVDEGPGPDASRDLSDSSSPLPSPDFNAVLAAARAKHRAQAAPDCGGAAAVPRGGLGAALPPTEFRTPPAHCSTPAGTAGDVRMPLGCSRGGTAASWAAVAQRLWSSAEDLAAKAAEGQRRRSDPECVHGPTHAVEARTYPCVESPGHTRTASGTPHHQGTAERALGDGAPVSAPTTATILTPTRDRTPAPAPASAPAALRQPATGQGAHSDAPWVPIEGSLSASHSTLTQGCTSDWEEAP